MGYVKTGGIIKILKQAAETDDQRWGRQLATVCEQVAIGLRLRHGGKSLLGSRPRKSPPADAGVKDDAS